MFMFEQTTPVKLLHEVVAGALSWTRLPVWQNGTEMCGLALLANKIPRSFLFFVFFFFSVGQMSQR